MSITPIHIRLRHKEQLSEPYPDEDSALRALTSGLATFLLAAGMSGRPAVAAAYSIIDLGSFWNDNSQALGINDAGEVVGITQAIGTGHAFLYDNRGIHDLGTLGSSYSRAYAINTAGQIVGDSRTADEAEHAFLSDATGMHDLGTLPSGTFSVAYGINASGQVAGVSNAPAQFGGAARAFLYSAGAMRDLGTLGGMNSYASAVDDAGQVAGYSEIRGGRPFQLHAFLSDSTGMHDLGALTGGDNSWAFGINDFASENKARNGCGTGAGQALQARKVLAPQGPLPTPVKEAPSVIE